MNHALIDKGIVLPSGEIGRDKINLLSGAYTPPFVEMLWTVTGGDTETADSVYSVLGGLYTEGREADMMEVLAEHPQARSYFLFSFLLDYDDVVQDFMAGQDGP